MQSQKYTTITVKATFNNKTLNLGKNVESEDKIKSQLQLRFIDLILDLDCLHISYEGQAKTLEQAFQNALNSSKNSIKVTAKIGQKIVSKKSEIKSSELSASVKIEEPQKSVVCNIAPQEIVSKPLIRRSSIKGLQLQPSSPQRLQSRSVSRKSHSSVASNLSNKSSTIKTKSRKNSDFAPEIEKHDPFCHYESNQHNLVQEVQKQTTVKVQQKDLLDLIVNQQKVQIQLLPQEKEQQYDCFNCLGLGSIKFTTFDQKKCYVCQGKKTISDSNASVKLIDKIVQRKFDKLVECFAPTLELLKKFEQNSYKFQIQPQIKLEKKNSIFGKAPVYNAKVNVNDVPQLPEIGSTFLPKFILQNTGAGDWPKQVYVFDFYINELIKIKSLKAKQITQVSFQPQKCQSEKQIQKKYRLFYYDQKGQMIFFGEDFGYKVKGLKKENSSLNQSKKIFELRIQAIVKRAGFVKQRPEIILQKLQSMGITYQNSKQYQDDVLMDIIQPMCKR